MSSQLMIGGQAIYGHRLNVAAVLEMPKADLSGDSSATDTADKGVKPKRLTVSLMIPFSKARWLTSLSGLAEARNDQGEALPYVIVDMLAQALKVRQVIFSNALMINEMDTERAWDVSFTLSEYKSPAEVAEIRLGQREVGENVTSFKALNTMIESELG